MRPIYLPLFAALAALSACGPAENVEVLPLPALERPSREARLGIPEVAGSWRFAGWEIIRGDTTSLERTFPSFGELRLDTQRLDSIAGTFDLSGGRRGVIGEVRRDGDVSLVTYGGGDAGRFITGSFAQDTLWLELASILPAEEWPRDARAAFVREPVQEPIAWLRGARPGDVPPTVDSLTAGVDSLGRPIVPGTILPGGVPGVSGQAGQSEVTGPEPRPDGAQPPPRQQPPSGRPQPPTPSALPGPRPSPAPPATPSRPQDNGPVAAPPVRPAPAPAPPPAPPPPAPQPEEDDGPRLLGEPVL